MWRLIFILVFGVAVHGQNRAVVNVGASPNDGTGDSVRAAFTKVNTNFYNLWQTVYTNGVAVRGGTNQLTQNWNLKGRTNTVGIEFDSLLSFEATANDAQITGINSLYLDGGNATIRGQSNLFLLTPEATNFTVGSNAVLTLIDPATGRAEYRPILEVQSAASSTLLQELDRRVGSVDNVAALIAKDPSADMLVATRGYHAPGDGGHGLYRWTNSLPSGVVTNTTDWFAGTSGFWARLINPTERGGSMATNALYFGDSVVQGSSATSAANTWWRLVSDSYGWTSRNMAFAGAVATDLTWQSQPGYSRVNSFDGNTYATPTATATNFNIFAKVGINDGADFPTTSGQHAAYLTNYYNTLLYFSSYWATPSKRLALDVPATGSWSAWNNQFGSSVGRQSTTGGSTLTFETMGDAIYVAFPVGLTNSTPFGRFWVSINGAGVELVDPNNVAFGNRNQYGTPESYIPFPATNSFWVKRYAGYGQRRQTVTITATNNTTLPSVVMWVAGSQQPNGPNSGPNVFLLENLNRAANAVRDATYSALRGIVNQVAAELGGDGLQVAVVRPNQEYDPANSPDGIHPDNAGMIQIARAVRQTVDKFRGLAVQTGVNINQVSASLVAPVSVSSSSAGVPAFQAATFGSAFGYMSTGNAFSYIARSADNPSVFFNRSLGSVGSPTAVTDGTALGRIIAAPHDGTGYQSGAMLFPYATENHSPSGRGTAWRFAVVPNGTTTSQTALTIGQDLSLASGNTIRSFGTNSGIPAFEATTANSGFGFVANGTVFSFIGRSTDGAPAFYANRANGSIASPTAVTSSQLTLGIIPSPHDGTGYATGGGIYAVASENHSSTAHGQDWQVFTVPNGTTTPVLAATFAQSGSLVLPFTAVVNTTSTGLQLNGDGDFGILANRQSNTGGKELAFQRARSGNAAVQNADVIGRVTFYPRNNTTYPGRRGEIRAQATETHSGTQQGTRLILAATATGTATVTDVLTVNGDGISVTGTSTLGSGGVAIGRVRHGVATLVGGTVTVSDANVTANTRIMLTSQSDGGTPGWVRVSARTPSTSFTITSSSGTDTSEIGWVMIEP